LRGIATRGASVIVDELFGWRRFDNGRQLGACLGLTPTPYSSGDSDIEQGISKSGIKQARTLMVELAWRWQRLQPTSELTAWFNRRFAHGGKRMRRIGIVALARRLAIALWRFVEHGEIPAGASPAIRIVATGSAGSKRPFGSRVACATVCRDGALPLSEVGLSRIARTQHWVPAFGDTDRRLFEPELDPSPDLRLHFASSQLAPPSHAPAVDCT
jgi:hypothetical protein